MDSTNIPKIIHYCWFGNNPKNEKIEKYIDSWKVHMPDFQIIEWNESNFDVNKLNYTREAYEMKKYAFVSDVARVEALYKYGGIYFDTDVEVLKNFEDILNNICVLGFEEEEYVATSMMAVAPKHPLFRKFVELYKNESFLDDKGNIIEGTNVLKLTELLVEKGLKRENIYQEISDGICIYPKEYFSPYVYSYGVYQITSNSYCVHHFCVSWLPKSVCTKRNIKKYIVRLIGLENAINIRNKIVGQVKGE